MKKYILTIILLTTCLYNYAQQIGIQTNLAGAILYPVIANNGKHQSFSIGASCNMTEKTQLQLLLIHNETVYVQAFYEEDYYDIISRSGIQLKWKYYLSKKQVATTRFFTGFHCDAHYVDRKITCIERTTKQFTRFEKRQGAIFGMGADLGYTFKIHAFTLEPAIGIGVASPSGNLTSQNDIDDDSLLIGTPTFFQLNIGFLF